MDSEFEQVILLLFKGLIIVLPLMVCLTVTVLIYDGMSISKAPEVWRELWSILDGFLRADAPANLIKMIIVLVISYEFIAYILKGFSSFIQWSASWLTEGKTLKRQLSYAMLLFVFGIVGLIVGFQAPAIEKIAMTKPTPTPRPTFPPPPTITPPSDLIGQDLSGSDWSGRVLDDAVLRSVNLDGANLAEASMLRVDLRDATLVGTNMERAILSGSDLRGSDLTRANLSCANLTGTNLEGVTLSDTRLSNADLSDVNFSGWDLSGLNLRGASLVRSNLQNTNLTGANLRGATLEKADLTGAEVELAQIVECSLRGANMPDGTKYDGRFHTIRDDAELDYLLEYDGLDPSETLSLDDYLRHYEISKDEWLAGQSWSYDNLDSLMAEADAWYAEHWPED